ncbi:MAG: PilZ domain-containing protein [Phycisphaerales bacterium]|nr:PilZ domain-containing protein [Phycisphaerales bacterium]
MNEAVGANSRNSLGVHGQVYKRLLEKLNDCRTSGKDKGCGRIHSRLEYNDPYILMVLESEDTIDRPITVAARNISRGGVGLLHSSFVYPNTRVSIHLTSNQQNPRPVRGIVQRCIHRGGVVHEVGVKFDEEINIQQYLRPDISECIQSFERVEPLELKGKVLLIGQKNDFAPLSRAMLQETSLAYKFVSSAEDARMAGLEDFELFVVLNDLEDCEGTEFVRELRDGGNKCPIVLVGSEKTELAVQKVRACGADMLVPWPMNQETLLCAIAEYQMTEWTDEVLEKVRSCMGLDKPTTNGLRGEIAKLGVLLDQQVRQGDAVRVYAMCGQIRALAPLLGMKQLRDLTLRVGEDIAEDGNLEAQGELIGDIVALCSSVARAA